jgi:hypothetical protein
VYHHHSVLSKRWGQSIPSGLCSHISGFSYGIAASRFFSFIMGRLLHNIQFLIFRNLTEDLVFCLTISSLKVFLKILPAVFSFLRRSCCLMLQSLIPLLHSSFAQRRLLNILLFKVPRWPCLSSDSPKRHDPFAVPLLHGGLPIGVIVHSVLCSMVWWCNFSAIFNPIIRSVD